MDDEGPSWILGYLNVKIPETVRPAAPGRQRPVQKQQRILTPTRPPPRANIPIRSVSPSKVPTSALRHSTRRHEQRYGRDVEVLTSPDGRYVVTVEPSGRKCTDCVNRSLVSERRKRKMVEHDQRHRSEEGFTVESQSAVAKEASQRLREKRQSEALHAYEEAMKRRDERKAETARDHENDAKKTNDEVRALNEERANQVARKRDQERQMREELQKQIEENKRRKQHEKEEELNTPWKASIRVGESSNDVAREHFERGLRRRKELEEQMKEKRREKEARDGEMMGTTSLDFGTSEASTSRKSREVPQSVEKQWEEALAADEWKKDALISAGLKQKEGVEGDMHAEALRRQEERRKILEDQIAERNEREREEHRREVAEGEMLIDADKRKVEEERLRRSQRVHETQEYLRQDYERQIEEHERRKREEREQNLDAERNASATWLAKGTMSPEEIHSLKKRQQDEAVAAYELALQGKERKKAEECMEKEKESRAVEENLNKMRDEELSNSVRKLVQHEKRRNEILDQIEKDRNRRLGEVKQLNFEDLSEDQDVMNNEYLERQERRRQELDEQIKENARRKAEEREEELNVENEIIGRDRSTREKIEEEERMKKRAAVDSYRKVLEGELESQRKASDEEARKKMETRKQIEEQERAAGEEMKSAQKVRQKRIEDARKAFEEGVRERVNRIQEDRLQDALDDSRLLEKDFMPVEENLYVCDDCHRAFPPGQFGLTPAAVRRLHGQNQ